MLPRLAPPAASRPPPSEWRALDLDRVLAVVGDHRPPALLLVPAEGGHVLVAAEQQPGLAGAGLGGEVALPGHDPVCARDPASGPSSARVPREGPVAGRARRGRRSRTGSRPGTSVRSASRTRRARRRTTRSWRASSSMLRAGASSIRLTERTKAAAIASRKPGAEPSTSLTETETIAAFSTSEPRPKVRTVSGSRTRISSGQRSALSSAIKPVVNSTASKLGTSKPGSRATTTQKISATSTQRISQRNTAQATRLTLRAGLTVSSSGRWRAPSATPFPELLALRLCLLVGARDQRLAAGPAEDPADEAVAKTTFQAEVISCWEAE